MTDTPQATLLTINPKMLEDIVKNHLRALQIEAQAGEFIAKDVDIRFYELESWEEIDIPAVQVSIYF